MEIDVTKKIRDRYDKLKAQHNLPAYEIVDEEFEISLLETDVFLLREIRRQIEDKINDFLKVLDYVLQPESSIFSMHESSFFNEEEKKDLFALYSKLMIMTRQGFEISISDGDGTNAKFIINVIKEWKGIKDKMIAFSRKLQEGWKSEVPDEQKLAYFG